MAAAAGIDGKGASASTLSGIKSAKELCLAFLASERASKLVPKPPNTIDAFLVSEAALSKSTYHQLAAYAVFDHKQASGEPLAPGTAAVYVRQVVKLARETGEKLDTAAARAFWKEEARVMPGYGLTWTGLMIQGMRDAVMEVFIKEG